MTYIIVSMVLLLTVCFFWRLYSNRHALPCPSWLAWLVELDNPFAKAHKAQSIVDSLDISENMKVLDIGCGPGRVMLPLAQAIAAGDGHVTGVDMQLDMIKKRKIKHRILASPMLILYMDQ